MQTTPHEIAQTEGWVLVATAPSNVLIQLRSTGRIEVVIASSAPNNTDAPLGILLHSDGATEFSVTDFGAGDNVYIRTLGEGQSETVSVLENGS